MADERAKAISLMLTSLIISSIIGALLAGILLDMQPFGLHGWQSLFILEAIPTFILTYVFWVIVKDHPEKADWLTAAEKEYLVQTYAAEIKAQEKVWLLCVIYFCQALCFWGFNFWMPQVLKGLSGWSTTIVGGAIAIPMLIALIAQIFWSAHSSKTGEKRWHIALALFVSAIGLGAAPFIANPYANLFFITLTAAGIYSQVGIRWTVPTTFLSGTAAAGATG